jgi:hypothetical protein
MATIIQVSDFTGEYKIADDCYNNLESYIEKYENELLVQLLGAELYGLFIADLTAITPQVPQDVRFLAIFNPFNTDDRNCLLTSQGIKTMLIQYVYFFILRDNLNVKTATGTVRMQNENSSAPSYNLFNLVEAYNDSINNFKAVQWYVGDNPDTYPEENMQFKDFINGI